MKNRRITSLEDARKLLGPRDPEDAKEWQQRRDAMTADELHRLDAWTREKVDEEERQREAITTEKRRRQPRVYASPLELADEPAVVAEFAALVLVGGRSADKALEGAWIAYGDLRRNAAGALVMGQLSIGPYNSALGESGVSYNVWQAIRPPELLRLARNHLLDISEWRDAHERFGLPLEDSEVTLLGMAAELGSSTPRLGRRPDPETRWWAIADAFLSAQKEATPRRGIYAILEREHGAPRATIRSWVKRAEQLGFLAPGETGKRGRDPGPRFGEYVKTKHGVAPRGV